ncbi:MAG: flagellar basal body-associated FliL family protein [Treponema sp.]|jgi:flagellar FliL protein|nr:flagellar basal body-associated FliL family protein [Treponema sp.]
MSDSDDLELDGGDATGIDSSPKKTSGLASLLPNILKFVAIGLGALVFIVTVAVITYNIMSKGGKSQTAVTDPQDPYMGKRPEYAYYTLIGSVTTKTKDADKSYSVTVDMIIGYDLNNNAAQTELTGRQYELRDFVRNYFQGKYSSELQPENEAKLKSDIRETLNTRFLDTAKVRIILFDKLDVMEMY